MGLGIWIGKQFSNKSHRKQASLKTNQIKRNSCKQSPDMIENAPLLVLIGLLGAEFIFLRSLSMLFTSLIRDGCRVKLGFPCVEKRFLAQFSFEGCLPSTSGGERGMAGLRPEREKRRVADRRAGRLLFLLGCQVKAQV